MWRIDKFSFDIYEGGKRSCAERVNAGVPGSDAHGSSRNRHRCWHECTSGEDAWTGESTESGEGSGKQLIPWSDYLCSLSVVRRVRCESIYFLTDR